MTKTVRLIESEERAMDGGSIAASRQGGISLPSRAPKKEGSGGFSRVDCAGFPP